MATDSAIVLKNLSKAFKKLVVLDGVNLEVKRGTIMALLGPNGAGKTTTVKILSTLLSPDSGQALINGYDVVKEPNRVRHVIGLTGQYAAIDEYQTGEQNLHMMGRLYRLSYPDIRRRTTELLEQLELTEAAGRLAKTYSGGMRRRLDLAASLIAAPPLIFLDEPTTGLDPRSRLAMWDIIARLVADGTTILLTTQYLEEADRLADRIAVLDNGKIIAEGTANELKAKVGNDRLELTIAASSNFDKAMQLLGGEIQQHDRRARTLSIATEAGVKQLRQVLDQLERAKIEVETVSLHRPTLDDVFLTLTGHEATKEPENQPPAKSPKAEKGSAK